MIVASLIPAGLFDRALDYAAGNLRIEKLLLQLGIDPNNVTYEAIFNRLLDLALVNITFANTLALIGGIFLISTFVVRTIVPMRVLCIVSIVFFLGSAVLAGSIPKFFMYLLALPVNVVRLVQIRNLVKKARTSVLGTLSLDWLRPYMTPRAYNKGEVLFRKGDAATEMFLTVSGKFLVTEIGIEIPSGRILGELGFLSPNNNRTQSVECIENGEVLTIAYDKLLEIYMENPEFGYFFLRLTSDRLLQNHARLEGLLEQSKTELDAAGPAKSTVSSVAKQTGAVDAATRETEPAKAAVLTFNRVRTIGASALGLRPKQGTAAPGSADADNVVEMPSRWKARLAAITRTARKPDPAEETRRLRLKAIAIVERHANYSALGGFIPLPIANVAAITVVIMRMVKELNLLYGKPVEHQRAYAIAIGLLGGIMPTGLARITASTVAPFLPGYNLLGLAVASVTASAYARSIGGMLIDHFERVTALQRDRLAIKRMTRWRGWLLRMARYDRGTFREALRYSFRRGWLRR